MTPRELLTDLREKAKAAIAAAADPTSWATDLDDLDDPAIHFIAACSPEKILALCDAVDGLQRDLDYTRNGLCDPMALFDERAELRRKLNEARSMLNSLHFQVRDDVHEHMGAQSLIAEHGCTRDNIGRIQSERDAARKENVDLRNALNAKVEESHVKTYPCPTCGCPIIEPHIRCQGCICQQRDEYVRERDAVRRVIDEIRNQLPDENGDDTDPTSCIDCGTMVEWRDEDETGLHLCDDCAQTTLAGIVEIVARKD